MKTVASLLTVLLAASAQAQQFAAPAQPSQLPQSAPVAVGSGNSDTVYIPSNNTVTSANTNSQAQPIYILNNPRQQVQEQPNTLIEGNPLSQSRAEQLRRARQGAETQTEQKIVEKLEEARMEDERARAERLFGNGFGSGRSDLSQPAAAPVAPAPTPVIIAPQPPQAVVTPEDKIDVREEIRAAIEESNQKPPEDPTSYYVSGLVGVAEYPDVVNLKGKTSTGFAVGVVMPERIVAEGSFVYSNYTLKVIDPYTAQTYYYPAFKDLQQYNFAAAIKYQILPGKFRPFLGALASYTSRKYSDKQFNTIRTNDASTNAFDIGVTAGADLMLTKNFAIGFDFRYFTNVSYTETNEYSSAFMAPRVGTPVEKLDYYTAAMSAKFTF